MKLEKLNEEKFSSLTDKEMENVKGGQILETLILDETLKDGWGTAEDDMDIW